MDIPAHERIQGSFLGLAWGDVFGCPVESWRACHIKNVSRSSSPETPAEFLEREAAWTRREAAFQNGIGTNA